MKKLNYIFLLVAALFVLGSCEKELELRPYQSLDEAIVLTTDQNVKNVLVSAYASLRNPALYGGELLRNSELLAGTGELSWQGTYNAPREIFNKQIINANEDVRRQWMNSYICINICNNVLSALDVVKEADRAKVEGEALFIRSMVYFDLLRFYAAAYEPGQNNSQFGVPLVTTPTRGITDANRIGRNTVEEVYTKIITDLTRAVSLLPNTNGAYATKGAANAILARVYLQKGDYAAARDAANAVIGSGLYTLNATYAAAFNKTAPTTEDIFGMRFVAADGINQMTEFWSIPEYGGRDGDIAVLNAHLNLYEANDARRALFYMGRGDYRSGKWNTQYGFINLIRLAEMFLIRAEGNQRLGQSVGATPLADYNRIRNRAGLADAATVDLNLITYERRLELAHEGHRFHDVKRLKQTAGAFAHNDPKMLFPIPKREIDANPALNGQQNPGY
jgi:starch-binding outer membrane protein, SusD/RagB family